jgi:hypothetical protein
LLCLLTLVARMERPMRIRNLCSGEVEEELEGHRVLEEEGVAEEREVHWHCLGEEVVEEGLEGL